MVRVIERVSNKAWIIRNYRVLQNKQKVFGNLIMKIHLYSLPSLYKFYINPILNVSNNFLYCFFEWFPSNRTRIIVIKLTVSHRLGSQNDDNYEMMDALGGEYWLDTITITQLPCLLRARDEKVPSLLSSCLSELRVAWCDKRGEKYN